MEENSNIIIINTLFDLLDKEYTINYTKMYNRNILIKAFSSNKEPHTFMNKTSNAFGKGMNNVFTNINKPKNIKWSKYLPSLLGYKKCKKCYQIKKLDNFSASTDSIDNKQTYCIQCNKNYRDINNENIKKNKDIYYNKNKKDILEKMKENYTSNATQQQRKETILYIIDVMIREGKLPECSICGYKENWAALDFHHINPELDRPEWSYDKYRNKKSPGTYIFGCKKETAEKRYLIEIDNLELLCANCHRETHNPTYNKEVFLK